MGRPRVCRRGRWCLRVSCSCRCSRSRDCDCDCGGGCPRGCSGGGKGGFGRAAAGRFAGAVAASQRLPSGARSCGPVAELATRPLAAALKQPRRVSFGCALRARPQALRSSAPQRRALPQPARTRLCSNSCGARSKWASHLWQPSLEAPLMMDSQQAVSALGPLCGGEEVSPDTNSPVDCLCLANAWASGPGAGPRSARAARFVN